ncbi:MAG: hypothetical protein IJE07_13020 [Clostridia bacterium]|nr:hypothetical protein [Clostridia bacterium]
MNDASDFKVILVWNNVLWTLDAEMPMYQNGIHNDGSYTITIDYLNHPAVSSDFSDVYYGDVYEADCTEPFPLLNGEIPYIVIEP